MWAGCRTWQRENSVGLVGKRRQTTLPKGERIFINHLAEEEEPGDDQGPGDGEEPAVPGWGF